MKRRTRAGKIIIIEARFFAAARDTEGPGFGKSRELRKWDADEALALY